MRSEIDAIADEAHFPRMAVVREPQQVSFPVAHLKLWISTEPKDLK